jgi:hypothetical protein
MVYKKTSIKSDVSDFSLQGNNLLYTTINKAVFLNDREFILENQNVLGGYLSLNGLICITTLEFKW